ncbi:MAG: helicase, partial [Sphingopyxis sp.]|nr:helicase [Sphingopyxis sp.]
LPPHGAVLQKNGSQAGLAIAGFRRCASGWLRIDMAEKLARQAHAARMQAAAPPTSPVAGGDEHHHDDHGDEEAHSTAPPGFVIDPALATSLGLDEETRRALLGSFGFRSVGDPALQRWRWSGLRKAADKRPRRKKDRRGSDKPPRAAVEGATRRPPVKQAKAKHGKQGKPRGDAPRPPRAPRPDRRGPSPNSPFAGLAAMLADARKD